MKKEIDSRKIATAHVFHSESPLYVYSLLFKVSYFINCSKVTRGCEGVNSYLSSWQKRRPLAGGMNPALLP